LKIEESVKELEEEVEDLEDLKEMNEKIKEGRREMEIELRDELDLVNFGK
jgi:hypothetical protein